MASEKLGLSADEQRPAEPGYKQEPHRGWSGFSDVAISSVLACCLATAWYGRGPIALPLAIAAMLAVLIPYAGWACKASTGPVRTIDLPDDGGAATASA